MLGNIEVGDWVRVGAGSVVVKPVEAHSTVVGIPGRVVQCAASRWLGKKKNCSSTATCPIRSAR